MAGSRLRALAMIDAPTPSALIVKLASNDRSGSADQPRQLLEAAADAVSDEIDQAMFKYQQQFAALIAEMRGRQDAGPRRRNQMGDTERGAEDARPLELGGGHHLLDDRRWLIFLAEAGIAEEYRQRDKSPALVIDRSEIAVDDQVQGLFAAMIGMDTPSEVGQ